MSADDQHFAHSLLSRAHSPTTAQTIFTEKIVQRPLFLRRSSPPPPDGRAQRRQKREARLKARRSQKPKPLSAAEKRRLCVYEIPKEQQKYALYLPLYQLWCGYMREILGLKKDKDDKGDDNNWPVRHGSTVHGRAAGPILASADMHGAMVEVVRSRCVSRVGLKGIIVKDSKFVFEIITESNELKSIPKEHTVFRYEVPLAAHLDGTRPAPLIFEATGSQFQNRAPDRATKKFRLHLAEDI